MPSSKRTVNACLDDEMFDKVTEIAENNNISRSEVVRSALKGGLSSLPKRQLSEGQLNELVTLETELLQCMTSSDINDTKVGVNINQIARWLNSHETVDSSELKAIIKDVQTMFEEQTKSRRQVKTLIFRKVLRYGHS